MNAKVEKPVHPSANDYAEAFYALEDRILLLRRRAKAARFLVGLLEDRCRDALSEANRDLMDIADDAVTDAYNGVSELDEFYLNLFNDFIERERAAGGRRSA